MGWGKTNRAIRKNVQALQMVRSSASTFKAENVLGGLLEDWEQMLRRSLGDVDTLTRQQLRMAMERYESLIRHFGGDLGLRINFTDLEQQIRDELAGRGGAAAEAEAPSARTGRARFGEEEEEGEGGGSASITFRSPFARRAPIVTEDKVAVEDLVKGELERIGEATPPAIVEIMRQIEILTGEMKRTRGQDTVDIIRSIRTLEDRMRDEQAKIAKAVDDTKKTVEKETKKVVTAVQDTYDPKKNSTVQQQRQTRISFLTGATK